MKNLDAYHDGLMHEYNDAYESEQPWSVVDYEDGDGTGYIVVNEDGDDDGMGYVFDTEHEAQRYANELNKEAMEGNDDFYIE
jgi:hypothetical protein